MSQNSQEKKIVIRIYKKYFDMIKDGSKTIEVRVAYPSMKKIRVGDVIWFNDDPNCKRRVKRVASYVSFREMMKSEDPKKINPNDSAEQQLSDIGKIYPPHKEKLGVLTFELEVV